jgi:excinuclease ABC subunit B
MAETSRRRERQEAYNRLNNITPASIKKNITDVMGSTYERDHLQVDLGLAEEGRAFIGHNLKAHLKDIDKRMREAAGNLEFEEAARLRDELKRLRATELAISDDPFAKQSAVESAATSAVKGGKQRPVGRSTKGRAGTRGAKTKSSSARTPRSAR